MKSHLLLAGACALALAACGPSGGGSGSAGAGDALNIAAFISAVESVGCGILPLASDLATLWEAKVKGKGDNVAMGKAIGDTLCAAAKAANTGTVSALMAPQGGKFVVIDGITIHYTDK